MIQYSSNKSVLFSFTKFLIVGKNAQKKIKRVIYKNQKIKHS